MSLKHLIREEETLLSYFKQMLSEPDVYEEEPSDIANVNVVAPVVDEAKKEDNSEIKYIEVAKEEEFSPQLQLAPKEDNQVAIRPTQTLNTRSLESLLKNVKDVSDIEKTIELSSDQIVQEDLTEAIKEEVKEAVEVSVQTKSQVDEDKIALREQQRAQRRAEFAKVRAQIKADVEAKEAQKLKEIQAIQEKVAQKEAQIEAEVQEKNQIEEKIQNIQEDKQVISPTPSTSNEWKNIETEEEFQTLFFTCQGVRFAVPLIDLGTIIETDEVTALFGKPKWFMGITGLRGRKINIVDTLKWVKPDINQTPERYPYLITLSDTDWSLGCDVLEGNKTLKRSEIKWRVTPGTRPWLAGIVKGDMCALLHVDQLVDLFKKGIDTKKLESNKK